jgi:hypothetical protein
MFVANLTIEQVFVSHQVYIDFLDILFCELFFINQIINVNFSCFIYGSLVVPILFILNGLGYIITLIILVIPISLINNRLDIL